MIKLSLVLPIYNTEQYLHECLDSCLDQDMNSEDYEIICINDGSTDRSLTILQEYSQKHNNIIVIDQKNNGLAAVRNTGIKCAKGQYIWFVDSDDFIEQNCLENIACHAIKNNIDVIYFDLIKVGENAKHIDNINDASFEYSKIYTNKKEIYSLNDGLYSVKFIVKRSLLLDNKLFFDEKMMVAEDVLFNVFFREKLTSAIKLNKVLYYYRQRRSSITHTKTIESRMNIIHSLKEMGKVYESESKSTNISKDFSEILEKELNNVQALIVLHLSPIPNDTFVRNELADLKRIGWYPYKPIWSDLKTSDSLPDFFIKLSKALLTHESFFWIYRYLLQTSLIQHRFIKEPRNSSK
jgi:glycosyltransferase involved in cell wall biosynthesis